MAYVEVISVSKEVWNHAGLRKGEARKHGYNQLILARLVMISQNRPDYVIKNYFLQRAELQNPSHKVNP